MHHRPGIFRRAGLLAIGLSALALVQTGPVAAQYYFARPVEALPPHAVGEIATMELGLHPVSRVIRNGSVYFVEGFSSRGSHMRYMLDAYRGHVLDRMVLDRTRQDRGEAERHLRRRLAGLPDTGEQRSVLRPPARVMDVPREAVRRDSVRELPKPTPVPQKAAAAATRIPVMQPTVGPVARPASLPGNRAGAQDTTQQRKAALPSAVTVTPALQPRLQNPDDLRLPSEPDRTPPLAARAGEPARPAGLPGLPSAPSSTPAPALLDDATPKSGKPPTPDVPVTGLN